MDLSEEAAPVRLYVLQTRDEPMILVAVDTGCLYVLSSHRKVSLLQMEYAEKT